MSIMQTVSENEFRNMFRDQGATKYSYDALGALFQYYDGDCEEEENYMLDVTAICCQWIELDIKDVIESYRVDVSKCENDEGKYDKALSYLSKNTFVIGLNNTLLFQEF